MRSDDGTFEEFVDDVLPRLLGLARVLVGNPHDAWDLTQETLARVGLRWHAVERDGNPIGYARTTLVRLNLDRLRRLRRELLVAAPPERPAADTTYDGVEPWLVAALDTLSPRQRTALALRYVEDLDVAAIAAEMRCSPGTVKSHLSRGLDRLREHVPAEVGTVGERRTEHSP